MADDVVPDRDMDHADKIAWVVETNGWCAEPVAPVDDPPTPGYTYSIGFEDTYDHPDVVIFGLIGSFQVFDQVFILTSGGPARSTETIVYRIYTEAFGNGKLGYASALSYVLLIMTLIVGLIQLYTNNKHEKEEIA